MTFLSPRIVGVAVMCFCFHLFALAQGARLDSDAVRVIERDGKVCVCVILKDASRPSDPRIVRAEDFSKDQAAFLATFPRESIRIRHRFRFSPVLLLDVLDSAALTAIAEAGSVEAIGLDAMGSGGLDQSRAFIRADEVHSLGITGAGRVAAILDTGASTDHPDLKDAILHQHHFLGGMADVGDGAEDRHSHGTNVTGIAASRGTVAPRGIAPGAKVILIKVLDDSNRGYLSDWAAGVEYVVGLHESGAFRIDAINMSLVSDAEYPGDCDAMHTAFSGACTAAVEAGIAVFASSGNRGSTTQMTSPACLSSVLSVGSVRGTLPDEISYFTSRNSSLELLAPGEQITSTGLSGGTSTFSGTSQACPHAVGLACLLREVSPLMPPKVLLAVMQRTGVSVFDPITSLTFPRIDALAAVTAARVPGDCNENGISDFIDITISETSFDRNSNSIPDECEPPPHEAPFRRADADASGVFNITDAMKVLLYLFSGDVISCADAADADDTGQLDITDGVYALLHLFLGGRPIPPPGPTACGLDPTLDRLGCEGFEGCE